MTLDTTWSYKDFADWTDEDLLACACWWAQELGLCAWRITAVFETRHKVEGNVALVDYSAKNELAEVRLSAWAERDRSDPNEADLEVDVAHELLHARLWAAELALETDTVEDQQHELAVERVARALVSNRRRGWK